MNPLHEVKTLQELSVLMPLLEELHQTLDGKWESDLTTQEFLCRLVQNFQNEFVYFARLSPKGELIYFASIGTIKNSPSKKEGFFWLFYLNPSYRESNAEVIQQLKDYMRDQGFKNVYLNTTRITSSYDRWVTKHGATKHSLTYKLTF
jgi:hypothetical protein